MFAWIDGEKQGDRRISLEEFVSARHQIAKWGYVCERRACIREYVRACVRACVLIDWELEIRKQASRVSPSA